MNQITFSEFNHFIPVADSNALCRVYPLSVAEGVQSGRIYSDSSESCVLIRHQNNFSFLSGEPSETFLRRVYDLVINDGLKLMCNDEMLCSLFEKWGGASFLPRSFYSYPSYKPPKAVIPSGYEAKCIDEQLFSLLEGRVSPKIFWQDFEKFMQNGKGVCLMYGSEPASWAFTAAVSNDEADIGIETAEAHRHRGLAYAASALLIKKLLPSRRPTWSCQQSNMGSARTAEKLGFVKYADCIMIKKAD